ncbi:MAG: hypothetical protein LBH70_05920 [Spirochaetaceae bacterium]|jgi:hypothetical protein|nr:hypothetical protein [Spirochaetaceae bacterium]
MTFQRSVIIAVCVSLGAGFLSFFLFRPAGGGGSSGGGYAVLSLDQSYSDRDVGAALSSAGIETFFSESNQWVYLDGFGELTRIPLDEYPGRLESFDPRNDGYAEKLRSFFVRDGMRRFFISLDRERGNSPARFTDRLSALLGDTPYTVEFLVQNQPSSRYWILFAVFGTAALISLFLSGASLLPALLIPLCIPLTFLGSPGMVLTGTIFAFSGSLIPPLNEFLARCRRGRFPRRCKPLGGRLEFPGFSCIMPLVFAAVYGAIFCMGNIPVLAAVPVLFACCCVTGAVLLIEPRWNGHLRFHPAPIKKTAPRISAFFRYFQRNYPRTILPWVPAAILALVLPYILTDSNAAPVTEKWEDVPVLYAEDYEAHLAFQRSFSMRILEDQEKIKIHPEYLPYSRYSRYSIGDDGLIREDDNAAGKTGVEIVSSEGYEEFPSFPLTDLMDFLTGYTPAVNSSIHTSGDLISIALILIPALPFLFRLGRKERKGGGALIFNDKRIAA